MKYTVGSILLLAVPVLLAACGQAPLPPAARAPGPAASSGAHRAPAALDVAVYAVDPAASLIAVTVRRAGLMARLGHEHVVASHGLTGFVAPDAGRAELSFRLDDMRVDEPPLLREAGIGTQPSPDAIEGTRRNMLGPVLEAQRYPVVSLHAQRQPDGGLRVAVSLHGVTRWMDLPAAVEIDANKISASGTARLKQSEFGIVPFSVGGGLLAVQDALELRYRIIARRQAQR
jgi:hypothetical protein